MTDEGIVQRLRPLLIEAERERNKAKPYSLPARLLIWSLCIAADLGVWTLLIFGVARAIDLAKGY